MRNPASEKVTGRGERERERRLRPVHLQHSLEGWEGCCTVTHVRHRLLYSYDMVGGGWVRCDRFVAWLSVCRVRHFWFSRRGGGTVVVDDVNVLLSADWLTG